MNRQLVFGQTTQNKSHIMNLSAPINRWDEAIPLGNGLTGVLIWGSDNRLRFSLDRGDLWDCRTPEYDAKFTWEYLHSLVKARNKDEINKIFLEPYCNHPYPTKLPAGRIELLLDESICAENFQLDMEQALGSVSMGKASVETFCSADAHAVMIRIKGSNVCANIVAPCYEKDMSESSPLGQCQIPLWLLDYDKAQTGHSANMQWFVQHAASGFIYAVTVDQRIHCNEIELAVAITTNADSEDPLALGQQHVTKALAAGYDNLMKSHLEWWKDFWAKSDINIPDKNIERHYRLAQYLYGSGSRTGTPPLPLQGLWTADEGGIPPWRGDYHNDLNTQFTYYTYLAANRIDSGLCFLEFLSRLMPKFENFAKSFYNSPGICVPGVMALDGSSIGGWPQYSFSPTNSAWIGHIFYLHWRYTLDKEFLLNHAYPFCSGIGLCLESLLKPDNNGKLKLPLSTSPEYHNASLDAWLTPNSNYDLSIMQCLFMALIEMAEASGKKEDILKWQNILEHLDSLAISTPATAIHDIDDSPIIDALLLSPDEPQRKSHHHFSPMISIFPLGTLNIDGGEQAQKIIRQSIHHQDTLGKHGWGGYCHAWMAGIAARAGLAERAKFLLDIYMDAFISRNGFMLNRDFKDIGASAFKGRYFTIEGNMMAALAVQEMLLQSWGGIVRIFPAIPDGWQDVEFKNLRAEGALLIDARRESGKTVYVKITAEHDTIIRLRNPFDNKNVKWNLKVIKESGDEFNFELLAGDFLEGTI